ncbi:hypothetical protein EST38_g9693 [Candolleomyces aberdarensis]|uniref:Uncharacterized protein n=1 Tax=Candolleomyces aberdarensis TaxID=2316362 RepID=A0A4Q2D9A5_9AGAR|nr:hypothetical protein EST38_g9693 [Candolleomyces aberdarensis]
MAREVVQDTITEETRDVMQDLRQGEGNAQSSIDHSKATVDPGSSGWEQDLESLRAKISTQLKAWEDSQRSSITKQLESYRAQQELQILKSIQSEASNTQTRPDTQAAELQKALDICRRERDELFRECQTLRSRERQLSDDLNEIRSAFTRQTLDLQADKVKLLEELNEAKSISHSEKVKLLEELHAAKSAHQVDHVKLLDDLNAAKSAQVKLLEELNTARIALAGITAGENFVKMKKLENDNSNGSEIASKEEAYAEETASPEELRVQESRRIGLIDEGPPDIVVPQCPQAGADEPPQERRQRWQMLTWRNRKTYDIEGSCSAYQLAEGTLIKMSKEGNILMLQLLTSRAPVYQVITHCNLNKKIFGFASDASQNLLVFFGCDRESVWVAMYSLTDSKPAPHSEATKQILQVSNRYDPEQAKWGHRQLYVWNWKIGTLIGDTLEPQDYWFDATAYEFSFVSPTLLHVTTPTNGNGAGSINLYSINPSSSLPARFTHLASLLLPPVKKDVEIVPVRSTTESLQANGFPNQFGTSQLSVLQIKYATHFGFFDSEQFQLVVPTSVFIDYCNELQSKALKLPITAQWDDWGPSKTRWIPRPHIPSSLFDSRPENLWTRYLRGQRVLALPTEGPGIEVLDFDFDLNSPPVNLDPSLQQDICTGPTVIPAGNVFRDDVVSSLPYIKTTRRGVLDEDFAGFAIDEERIIAISVEGTGSNRRISKLTTVTF